MGAGGWLIFPRLSLALVYMNILYLEGKFCIFFERETTRYSAFPAVGVSFGNYYPNKKNVT